MEVLLPAAALIDPRSVAELRRLVNSMRADFDGDDKSFGQLAAATFDKFAEMMVSHPRYVTTIEVVKEQAPRTLKAISDSRKRLQILWSSHNEVIQHRWLRRNSEKRKKILLEAWPEMPGTHRPDFRALRRGLTGPSSNSSVYAALLLLL